MTERIELLESRLKKVQFRFSMQNSNPRTSRDDLLDTACEIEDLKERISFLQASEYEGYDYY